MSLARERRMPSAAATASVLYFVALLAVWGALGWVGERCWVTGITLYLPRIVFAAPLPIVVVWLAASRAKWRSWMFLLPVVALLAALMGFVPPSWTSRAAEGPTMRVLAYNVDGEIGSASGIADEIERYSPDAVFLEEMGAAEPLSGLLRSHYETVRTTSQFLLATRYRLVSVTEPERLSYAGKLRSPRFVRYVLDTSLGQVVFYNVHPISPRESFYEVRGPQGLRHELFTGRVFSNAHSNFYANSGLRALQVQAFTEAASRETDPVLIAGDTNLPDLSPVFRRFLSGYQDGFATVGWGFGYTFPTNRVPWMRIDRILATKQLRFVGFQSGQSRVSDHLCVLADLQRAP